MFFEKSVDRLSFLKGHLVQIIRKKDDVSKHEAGRSIKWARLVFPFQQQAFLSISINETASFALQNKHNQTKKVNRNITSTRLEGYYLM